MVIPNYSSKADYDLFYALGVSQYGQMTAGSYCYIGPQGIVHGTTITLFNAGRKSDLEQGVTVRVTGGCGQGGGCTTNDGWWLMTPMFRDQCLSPVFKIRQSGGKEGGRGVALRLSGCALGCWSVTRFPFPESPLTGTWATPAWKDASL